MKYFHDPFRQANYIQQSLAQDKIPLGLFLGAGCPLSIKIQDKKGDRPLIPDIEGLTKIVCDEFTNKKNPNKESFEKILSQLKQDGVSSPNIEDILSHIRSLRQVAGRDIVRGLDAPTLDKLDGAISETIASHSKKLLPNTNSAYHKIAAWISSTSRSEPVEIFTTNYDLLTEQALEELRVPHFDGFVGSYKTFFDPQAMEEDTITPRWARLWKLHGSINWFIDEKNVVRRGNNPSEGQRRLIHPSHLKYDESRRMPYLAMIDRLKTFLKKPSCVLMICGYSFRDDHINEVLIQGLQGNSSGIIFALLFGSLKNYVKAIELGSKRANLNILSEDEGIIGTKRAKWIESNGVDKNATHSIAVEWSPEDVKVPDGAKISKFKLGDFNILGQFLEDLIGLEKEQQKASNEE